MKYYIIAGEASGDLHGSNLIKELKKQDAQADIRCWGGDLMQAAGGVVVKHYRDLAFMGFVEVLTNLRTIFRNLDFCKQDILAYQPDALILVDYPGFNLRITKWAHRQRRHTTIASTHLAPQTPAAPPASSAAPQASSASPQQTSSAAGPNSTPALHSPAPISAPQASPTSASGPATSPAGFRIIYYISPQVWAWKENRVKQIRECVDRMLVILPFEKEFYRKWNYEVEYVGHPLVEEIDDYQAPTGAIPGFEKPVIALLPGSRKQEILKKLPVMLKVSEYFPDYQFVVARAPGQDQSFYDELLAPYPGVASVGNQTYALLQKAHAACVTSGTATLETALFGVPEVVCYKGSAVSYQIARRLIRVKYISLVNLIMDKPVVKELIQDELTPANLRRELDSLLNDAARRDQLTRDYQALKTLLSQGGHASANAARSILTYLRAQPATT